ncbi:MAG TPA: hypothetical protein P5229_00035 [Candidatus Gracilibacteria bacterium]|nr:hypothetical protein [Candidatus Gracilibacteria bacterium]
MFGFGKKKKKQKEEALRVAALKREQEERERLAGGSAEVIENGQQAKDEPQKKKGRIDSLVMGAIVGVAVGSVIGIAVGPKKDNKNKAGGKLGGLFFGRKKNALKQGVENKQEVKRIPTEAQ